MKFMTLGPLSKNFFVLSLLFSQISFAQIGDCDRENAAKVFAAQIRKAALDVAILYQNPNDYQLDLKEEQLIAPLLLGVLNYNRINPELKTLIDEEVMSMPPQPSSFAEFSKSVKDNAQILATIVTSQNWDQESLSLYNHVKNAALFAYYRKNNQAIESDSVGQGISQDIYESLSTYVYDMVFELYFQIRAKPSIDIPYDVTTPSCKP